MRKLSPHLACMLLAAPLTAIAITPLNENDLGGVSAEVGANLLNILGAPGAGLTEDTEANENNSESEVELETTTYQESEAATPVAKRELEQIENELAEPQGETTFAEYESKLLEQTVSATKQLVISVDELPTSSEIVYNPNGRNYEAKFADNGVVTVDRQLSIDVLKLENIRGDGFDDGRNAGNLFLHDWSSRGSTTMTPR